MTAFELILDKCDYLLQKEADAFNTEPRTIPYKKLKNTIHEIMAFRPELVKHEFYCALAGMALNEHFSFEGTLSKYSTNNFLKWFEKDYLSNQKKYAPEEAIVIEQILKKEQLPLIKTKKNIYKKYCVIEKKLAEQNISIIKMYQ